MLHKSCRIIYICCFRGYCMLESAFDYTSCVFIVSIETVTCDVSVKSFVIFSLLKSSSFAPILVFDGISIKYVILKNKYIFFLFKCEREEMRRKNLAQAVKIQIPMTQLCHTLICYKMK